MSNDVCKICRRLGQRLFLKGEKCLSPKCIMVKKSYPPGPKKRRRFSRLSEYGKELAEKQKLREYFGLRESQFRKHVRSVLKTRGEVGDTTLLLIRELERRLDNIIFRLGFARSRKEARKLVSQNYFLVDSKQVNIPSFTVKRGQVISFKKGKKKKQLFKNLSLRLKSYQPPSWLKLNQDKMEGTVIGEPEGEDIASIADIPSIFEFYSR